MNRMVPMAALVNWNYRPRWGFEGYCGKKILNQQIAPESPMFQGITWRRLMFAPIAGLAAFFLPTFLKSDFYKYLFGILFVLSVVIATLYTGVNSWVLYLLVLVYLYPIVVVHLKKDPLYMLIENITESPPPYPGK